MAAAAAECCFSLRYINAADSPSTATGEPVSCPAKVGLGSAEVDYLANPSASEVLARDCNRALADSAFHDHTGYVSTIMDFRSALVALLEKLATRGTGAIRI